MWFEWCWMHLCINESSVHLSITKEYLQIIQMKGRGFDSYMELSSSFIVKQPSLNSIFPISWVTSLIFHTNDSCYWWWSYILNTKLNESIFTFINTKKKIQITFFETISQTKKFSQHLWQKKKPPTFKVAMFDLVKNKLIITLRMVERVHKHS